MKKGKVCYIYTTQYNNWLFDPSIFKEGDTAYFISRSTSTHNAFQGAAFRSKKVDTTVHNEFIVQVALQEALTNCPLGFQYQFVPQQAFTGPEKKLDTSVLRTFNPDIIINLKSLSLQMTGDMHNAGTSVTITPRIVNACCYSMTVPVGNIYGDILMDYTAIWEIRDIEENTLRNIKQQGRYVSIYHGHYALNKEVMLCAKKIGKEFSDLFKNSYSHVF